MSTPRCSLPDIIGSEDMMKRRRRRKRYALSGLKWHKTDLTWSVHSYPSPSTSPGLHNNLVDNILTYAFKAWSNAAPLRFNQVARGSRAEGDIRVSFSQLLHNDGYPFDGRGGTLAHAFFPFTGDLAGDTHFDDDEVWSYGGIFGLWMLELLAVLPGSCGRYYQLRVGPGRQAGHPAALWLVTG
uniref:Peptidase metallopeptidase domain-containing protein n=1 Tax=Monopterus albus TaxID=43700 RepID=A0A3Q3KCT7_MONAL